MSIDWITGVSLLGADWILLAIVAAWLLIAEPVLGRRSFQQFLRALAAEDTDTRSRFYRSWIIQAWVLMILILAVVLLGFDWIGSQLGLRVPHLSVRIPTGFVAGFLSAALAGLVLGIVLARRENTRKSEAETPAEATPDSESMKMLPRTPRERRWFAALAVTAGITEEVIWRGVLLAVLVAAFPGMPLAATILLMAIMFGWAHLYQGVGGILATAALGAMLTALYLVTASLILPMVVHALIDLLAILRTRSNARVVAD